MTTPQRWWAPAEPGIGPDELDLRLLTPGTDNRKDLGAAFLGMHRVGAAACEAVATQPLADESVFAQVLAAARKMVAPSAVGAVSKAVGQATYAGLLVRDVLDDAEQAALSLYRSCVAKGVAPPVVAKRVGAVFGVPLRELGRYTTLAMDPKANQAVLDDLADRTLFGFVAKMVEEEGVDEVVEVSKEVATQVRTRSRLQALHAAAQQTEREWKESEHPRNEEGEFAPKGRTVTQRHVAPGRKVAQRQVVQRKVTSMREAAERSTQDRAALERTGQARAGQKRAGQVKASQKRARLSQKAQQLQARTELTIPKHSYAGQERDVPDMLAERHDPNKGEHRRLKHDLSFVMPADDWEALRGQMGVARDRVGARQVFRAGALEEYHGNPLIYMAEDADGDEMVTEEHEHAVGNLAGMLAMRDEHLHQTPPETRLLHSDADVKAEKTAFISEMMGRYGLRNTALELAFVQEVPDADNPEMTRLVWQPPTPGTRPGDRPVRQVVELVLPQDQGYGIDHSWHGAANPDINVDPNLPLTVEAEENYFDEKLKAYRTRIFLSATGEDDIEAAIAARESRKKGFGKAETGLRAVRTASLQDLHDRAQQWDPAEHPRSAETGEFVPSGQGRTVTQRRTTPQRQVAQRRVTQRKVTAAPRAELHTAAQQRTELQRAGQQRTGQTRGGLTRTPLTRAQLEQVVQIAAQQRKAPSVVYFDPYHRYYAPDEKSLARLYPDDLPMDELAKLESWVLDSPAAIMLNEQMTDSDRGRFDLMENASNHFFDNLETDTPYDSVFSPAAAAWVESEDDLDAIAMSVEDMLFDLDDSGDMMLLEMEKDPVDQAWYVTVKVSDTETDPRHLFRLEEGQVFKRGTVIRNEGPRRVLNRQGIAHWLKMRFKQMNRGTSGGVLTDQMPNPIVHTWSASDEP